jgi:predicted ABC-type exoprotein transport system permease subunit
MAKAKEAHLRAYKSYSKRMSDHVAFALVIYTLALIFLVTPTIESGGTSIFPYFVLVLFVAAVIPLCRNLERRWQALDANAYSGDGLESRYFADRLKLWVAAVGIPSALAVLFTVF